MQLDATVTPQCQLPTNKAKVNIQFFFGFGQSISYLTSTYSKPHGIQSVRSKGYQWEKGKRKEPAQFYAPTQL